MWDRPAASRRFRRTSLGHFLVSWAGSDDVNGSGIAFYDIYVSEDGGPFELWLGATTATQAIYPGRTGHTYAFYSLAYDGVGHREEAPAVGRCLHDLHGTQTLLCQSSFGKKMGAGLLISF